MKKTFLFFYLYPPKFIGRIKVSYSPSVRNLFGQDRPIDPLILLYNDQNPNVSLLWYQRVMGSFKAKENGIQLTWMKQCSYMCIKQEFKSWKLYLVLSLCSNIFNIDTDIVTIPNAKINHAGYICTLFLESYFLDCEIVFGRECTTLYESRSKNN